MAIIKPQSNITKILKPIVERIEKLAEEKQAISDDISDIYKEAKGNGLDVKTIREMIKVRKKKADERAEAEFLRDQYLRALGLIEDLA
jgi:uncharacterized protein (UPF0335 family)